MSIFRIYKWNFKWPNINKIKYVKYLELENCERKIVIFREQLILQRLIISTSEDEDTHSYKLKVLLNAAIILFLIKIYLR